MKMDDARLDCPESRKICIIFGDRIEEFLQNTVLFRLDITRHQHANYFSK